MKKLFMLLFVSAALAALSAPLPRHPRNSPKPAQIGSFPPGVASGSLDKFGRCTMDGDGKNAASKAMSRKKNRYDAPTGFRNSPTFSQVASSLGSGPKTDKALNALKIKLPPDVLKEGQPVQLTGFIKIVKPGGNEACNNHQKDAAHTDTHLYLVPHLTDGNDKAVIIEVTPRSRYEAKLRGLDWSTTALKRDYLNQKVTVGGWLFYDDEHWTNAANNPKHAKLVWRSSCWEVHPVTNLDKAN